MFDFHFECMRDGDVLCFKLNGFTMAQKLMHIKEAIISEIKSMEGQPYKIMFDFRGLKALDHQSETIIKEIYEHLYRCSALKIGSVFDNMVTKQQHLRLGTEKRDLDEADRTRKDRSKVFDDLGECLGWLKN